MASVEEATGLLASTTALLLDFCPPTRPCFVDGGGFAVSHHRSWSGERPELRPICGDDTHDAADCWSFVNGLEVYGDRNLCSVIIDETQVISHDLPSSACDETSDRLFR